MTLTEFRRARSAVRGHLVGSRRRDIERAFGVPPTGTCVARSTRVEEDGFAGGPFVGCAGGRLP